MSNYFTQTIFVFSVLVILLSQNSIKAEHDLSEEITSDKEATQLQYQYRHSFPKYSVSVDQKDDKIFFYIEFPEEIEKRCYKNWYWDAINQSYIESNDEETILAIIIRNGENNNSTDIADIWIWRAFMSDPAGIAEDFYALIQNNKISKLARDFGSLCWEPVYYENFKGEKLPRFKHKSPSGSYADVSAKGVWKDEHWKIILSRKLNTENPDDIVLEKNKKYDFFFCFSMEKILNFSDLDKITLTIK